MIRTKIPLNQGWPIGFFPPVDSLQRNKRKFSLGEPCPMQLTIREVAKALQVNENTIYSWISDQQLPAELVNGQYYFNRSQVLEWATVRKLKFSPSFFQSGQDNGGIA